MKLSRASHVHCVWPLLLHNTWGKLIRKAKCFVESCSSPVLQTPVCGYLCGVVQMFINPRSSSETALSDRSSFVSQEQLCLSAVFRAAHVQDTVMTKKSTTRVNEEYHYKQQQLDQILLYYDVKTDVSCMSAEAVFIFESVVSATVTHNLLLSAAVWVQRNTQNAVNVLGNLAHKYWTHCAVRSHILCFRKLLRSAQLFVHITQWKWI